MCTEFEVCLCIAIHFCLTSDLFMLSGDGRRFEQRLTDMMIPESYLGLQQRIHSEASYFKMHQEKGPPILSWNDIVKYESACIHNIHVWDACMYMRVLHT